MEDLVEGRSASGFWSGRRVFLTGHTGFKGGWLALWLAHLGANVRGYALDPWTDPNLFMAARIGDVVDDVRGDIRDGVRLDSSMREFRPEVVFHLAAQPLVRYSYEDPIGTYETNVIGTARVLDAVRRTPSVRAVVSVTTDKCYENKEWVWPYRETDPLGGYDPYSSSKACAEIVSAAFRQSYFPVDRLAEHGVAVATARAGNVIGGGDWALDRLVPDIIRATLRGEPVQVRNPGSIRPWQHVLEALGGYLLIAERLLDGDAGIATAFNFGPTDDDTQPVSWVVDRMLDAWGGGEWTKPEGAQPHEAALLRLDCTKALAELGWRPRFRLQDALDRVVEWHKHAANGGDARAISRAQIDDYMASG
jgi:CDP-glucose 4,6-dehydratase